MLPLFPQSPDVRSGFSVHKKPSFSSIVHVGKTGRVVSGYQQSYSAYEFDLRYEVLRDETQNIAAYANLSGYKELQTLQQFYLAAGGQYAEFYYDDPTDRSRTDQAIGTGNGTTKVFGFFRTVTGASGAVTTEPVGGVNIGQSVVIKINGTPLAQAGNWNITSDFTTLTFTTAPAAAAAITSTFYYYYRCRWITDELGLEEFFYNRWQADSVRFRSVMTGANFYLPLP